MNTSILDNDIDTTPEEILLAPPGLEDLTQQEIEAGLDRLLQALGPKRLPFLVLIEDNPAEAELFRMALKSVGAAVEFMHFRDGQQALDFYNGMGRYSNRQRYPLPQLTVLDLKLTRRSGLQILQDIRSQPPLKKHVVVALTGSEDTCDIEQAQALAINAWHHKPQAFSDLVEIVRRLLQTWLP